ncbi:MAG: efflux RND transporter permease subunit [Hyphomicrobiaceae bacterium]
MQVPKDHAHQRAGTAGGIVGAFLHHRTAPNLLMIALIMIGLFAFARLNRQFFPNFDVPIISVTVNWPGASAEDVEAGILDVLEPELRFIENATDVISIAREGVGVISLEFDPRADLQKAQSDIEQAVARVTTLPEQSERPLVSRATLFDTVGSISLTGPFSEKVLKAYAKQLRDGLLAAGIDRVKFVGVRDEEIWIRIREEELRRLGLTLDEVARRVRENTQDLPAGRLEGRAELQLRALNERKTPEAIGEIEVKSLATGEKVRLADIAEIDTRFERDAKIGLVRGGQAIELQVQRALTADTLQVMERMSTYLAKARAELPPTLQIGVYDVRGKLVEQRLNVLIDNGWQGLVLVLLALFVFLNARIAFWTAAGIPVVIFATLAAMYATGQSINMVSMFALIMMLGIIVDDAIVVGEEAATLEERGAARFSAAEQGALRMLAPVMAATATTMAAFLPIFFIGDRIGDIFRAIPMVVIAALIASTIECFLILPGHLAHGASRAARRPSRLRRGFDAGFQAFRDRLFFPVAKASYRFRYATVALLIGGFVVAVGLLAGGRVRFVFFPNLPPENITASLSFAPGVPREAQVAAVDRIEQALFEAERNLLAAGPAPAGAATGKRDSKLVEATFAVIGQSGRTQADNIAEIQVQLTASEERSTPTRAVIDAWRRAAPSIPGLERVTYAGRRGGPPGRDVDVRLQNAPVGVLKAAAEELKVALTAVPGVSAIEDDLPYGKQELTFALTPRGTALGFTGQSVGTQVRNAFEGAIATRFALGDNEVTVRVMRAQEVAGMAALERVHLTTPRGDRVPLTEIVEVRERQSFSIVQRRNGVRTVAVTADLDTEVMTTEGVIQRLEAEIMPALARKHGLTYQYAGRDEERRKAFKDLGSGAMLALAMIYIILGLVFASYLRPLAVMAIIPFGFVGAVVGHYVTGFDLTIISMIGLLGLSGILVNDSIVLVSRVQERLAAGDDLETAATGAARDRLRAVMLTSLTTMGGLAPLMFERSLQAQFLIPLAVTLVFGLAGATVLVLMLVPALVGIGGDLARVGGGLARLYGVGAKTAGDGRAAPAEQM